mgnify:FL=1
MVRELRLEHPAWDTAAMLEEISQERALLEDVKNVEATVRKAITIADAEEQIPDELFLLVESICIATPHWGTAKVGLPVDSIPRAKLLVAIVIVRWVVLHMAHAGVARG